MKKKMKKPMTNACYDKIQYEWDLLVADLREVGELNFHECCDTLRRNGIRGVMEHEFDEFFEEMACQYES